MSRKILKRKLVRHETKVKAIGEVSEIDKALNPKIFDQEPVYVNYKLGATLNIGNYESLRVDVGLTVPCQMKDVNSIIDKTKKRVVEEIKKEVKMLRNAGGL